MKDAKEIDEDVDLEDEVKSKLRLTSSAESQLNQQKGYHTKNREAERNLVLAEFMDKKGTLTTGIIQRVENRNVIVNIGKTDAIMPQKDQIPGEILQTGQQNPRFRA